MIPAFINWSGGKDCCLALHKILEEKKFHPEFLFTTVSKNEQRVSMHGVRKELITRQGFSLGIKSRKLYIPADNTLDTYNKFMHHELKLMQERGIHQAVYGDIFLEDLKKYREEKLKEVDLTGIFPLWKQDSRQLIEEFISLGYKAMIICINAKKLDQKFLGRTIDPDLINELPSEVDVCGENGEYHTFVYDGPIFKEPIPIIQGEKVFKEFKSNSNSTFDTAFWYQDICLP
jgi:uncharacterized protein (TIGR00290 family)